MKIPVHEAGGYLEEEAERNLEDHANAQVSLSWSASNWDNLGY